MRRIGETSETERHMSKTCGGRDGQEKTELAREEGGGGVQNPARSITKTEQEGTTEHDGQMREAALLSLSSHSVLLSIREEYTPSSIPHYTPSVTVCVSACVCPRFDWCSTPRGMW